MSLKIAVTCPSHRGYDPAKQGEAGIRGGCIPCTKLLELWNRVQELKQLIDVRKESSK